MLDWIINLFWSGAAANIVAAALLAAVIWVAWVYGFNRE